MKKIILFTVCFIMIFMEVSAMQSKKLTDKEKSIVEISSFICSGNQDELAKSFNLALDKKISINEINEILIKSYAYCGAPKSLNAVKTFSKVAEDRKAKGIKDIQGNVSKGNNINSKIIAEWSVLDKDIEKNLKEYPFENNFTENQLTNQEEALAVTSFLAVLDGAEEYLKSYIMSLNNKDIKDDKLNYVARYAQFITEHNMGVFKRGAENTAYAKYFIGTSYLDMLSTKGVTIGNVVFEPGCRNNWHIHHKGGQILLVTGGSGWYQEWGKPARKLKSGDVVNIPAGVKHWHGASKDSFFAHLAVEVPAENAKNEWLEPVKDEEYNKLK